MSQEERTRDEVLNCLVAQTAALNAITQGLIAVLGKHEVATPAPKIEDTIGAPPPAIKKTRALKSKAHDELVAKVEQAEAEAALVTQTPAPVEKMAEIVPTKPGKTLADLRVALQACITKHGMPEAKNRLQPYGKVSDVPDEALANVIDKLTA